MGYNREAQKALDQIHLKHPQPGDYWHEMYCPIARVLTTEGDWVVLQKVTGLGGQEISETDPKPRLMKLSAFKKWLSYDSMPDKTWASVMPQRYPLDDVGSAGSPK